MTRSTEPLSRAMGSTARDLLNIYMGNLQRDASTRRVFVRIVINERPAGEIGASLIRSGIALLVTTVIWLLGKRLLEAGAAAAYAVPSCSQYPE